ncbi:MAG TPA: DUF1801 domain-containing protein [Candidatus Acidoferrales bacterium]|jgi:uncharacterized protein YdhG (YjbR/CyaY superfamily)|nr:DUF1801 domain-containing protein [Candidatus Acidoferrales bacterium]
MPRVVFTSVDEYIASQPEPARSALRQVRDAIRVAVPEAEELIAYNMPTYKLNGTVFVHFGGWKDHYSIYAATKSVLAAFKPELRRYEIEKGTIRFPLSERVPMRLIERIAKLRAKEVLPHPPTSARRKQR